MSRRVQPAYEIARPRVPANFRPSPAERHTLKAPHTWRQKRTGMSEDHLRCLRKLSCSVCHERRGLHVHHLKSAGARLERGLGLKATDRHTIPLCWIHHDEIERVGSKNEIAHLDKWGLDGHVLAAALWAATGAPDDARALARMGRILLTHKQLAIRTLRKRAVVGSLMARGLTRREAEEQYDSGIGEQLT